MDAIIRIQLYQKLRILLVDLHLKPRSHEQILCGNFCVTNIMDRVDI